MKKVPRGRCRAFAFDRKADPVLAVKQGEIFALETEDALGGCIKDEKDLPVPSVIGRLAGNPMYANPVVGPIYVEGVEPGDVLSVEILKVIPERQGFTTIVPGMGPLRDSHSWPECRGPYTKIIKHKPGKSGTAADGTGVFSDKVSWPLRPFIGTIAVAPERETESSLLGQGPWGGNLDSRDICPGNTLQLPAFNSGGLLFVGDAHGSQADSEFYGVADETNAEVHLRCRVVKKKTIPFARIDKRDSLVQLNCYRPLEDAITQAFLWLIEWLEADYGVSPRDAYLQMSVNPDVRINVYQMTPIDRLQYTVGVEFPKRDLR